MVLDAALRVAGDAVEGLDDLDGFDDEAGFFEDFAADGFFEGLAELDGAAWEGPLAFEGLPGAADEQDGLLCSGTVAEDDGTDAGDGRVWVFTSQKQWPQGLKPRFSCNIYGTAEAVPLRNENRIAFATRRQSRRGLPNSPSKTVRAMLKRPPLNLSGPFRWPMARSATTS